VIAKTVFQKKRCFFIFLLPVGDKNIKARFFAKNRAELPAPALLQIKILCAFLCIRLSSSAVLTQSIVKKMFWVVAFLYSSIQRMQEYKSTVFCKKPCGAAGDIARRLRILRALIVFACLHQQSNG